MHMLVVDTPVGVLFVTNGEAKTVPRYALPAVPATMRESKVSWPIRPAGSISTVPTSLTDSFGNLINTAHLAE